MTKSEFRENLKKSFKALADDAGLNMSMCSIIITDTNISFQVSMDGDTKPLLEDME